MSQTISKYALYAIIAALIIMLLKQWSAFSEDYKASEDAAKLAQFANTQAELSNETTAPYDAASNSMDNLNPVQAPMVSSITGSDTLPTINGAPDNAQPNLAPSGARTIVVYTDTLRVSIDKLGGDIVEVAMLNHLESLDENAEPLRLLEKNGLRTYTAESDLIPNKDSSPQLARPFFSSSSDTYTMEAGQPLNVVLVFKDTSGVELNKIFSFNPSEYSVDVNYAINNRSDAPWQARFYAQISRDESPDPGTEDAGFGMRSYLGAATTTADSPYEKITFKDIAKKPYRNDHTDGWVAMIQHYFVSAWIPERGTLQHYFTKKTSNGINIIGLYSDPIIVEAGQTKNIGALFYAGPKNQYRLAEIANHLDLTIDYGWLWMLSQPLYALLHMFATGDLHAFGKVFHVFGGFHNWGVSIIMLTVVVKAVFFRLSAASYRSMANMRRVQPKLLALRERYANDKQAQSKAMMELYQKEKINPLGGCLPILIQMPVFIALYWALMESVELRHAPFMLWIKDLSVMDPLYILPLLMGVTMWFQQRMNPAPPDPMQAKVMAWMPVVFTFFFLWFPAGLVIYWVSNNILSISQQWVITRQIEKAAETS